MIKCELCGKPAGYEFNDMLLCLSCYKIELKRKQNITKLIKGIENMVLK